MKDKRPVKKDGKIEKFTLSLKDISGFFRCSCGANVFHKPDDTKDDLFKCNACEKEYETEQ